MATAMASILCLRTGAGFTLDKNFSLNIRRLTKQTPASVVDQSWSYLPFESYQFPILSFRYTRAATYRADAHGSFVGAGSAERCCQDCSRCKRSTGSQDSNPGADLSGAPAVLRPFESSLDTR